MSYDTKTREQLIAEIEALRQRNDQLEALVTRRQQMEEALRKSEQRLSLHIQQTPLAYVEWDLGFQVVEWNPAAERMFGYSKSAVLGQHAGLIVPEAARPLVDQIWDALLEQKGGTRSTNDNVTKDGRIIACEWYNTPLVDADGEVIGVASLVQDITERQQAEEALRKSEQRLSLHIQQTPLAYVEWDLGFQVVEWNPAAERMFGYSKSAALGQHAGLIVPEAARPLVDQIWDALLEQKGGTRSINDNVTKDGRIIACEWYNTPLVDADGEVIGVASLVQDITERQQAEEALHQSMLQEEIIRKQSSILRELSTPLIPISDQVLVMPLVGAIDAQRVQQLVERLLNGIAQSHAQIVILDITGVPVVDTEVANGLIQAARAVRLLGAQVVLTGIRSEVAQTLVGLGVDLSGLITHSTLQTAIAAVY